MGWIQIDKHTRIDRSKRLEFAIFKNGKPVYIWTEYLTIADKKATHYRYINE